MRNGGVRLLTIFFLCKWKIQTISYGESSVQLKYGQTMFEKQQRQLLEVLLGSSEERNHYEVAPQEGQGSHLLYGHGPTANPIVLPLQTFLCRSQDLIVTLWITLKGWFSGLELINKGIGDPVVSRVKDQTPHFLV